MCFASDNAGPAHPRVMDALNAANTGYQSGYGAEPDMDRVTHHIRDLFDAPDATVFLVATGTAANAILLGTLANPWDTAFCTPMAHIQEDECNAPEFYSGAKLTLVPATHGKMTPDALHKAMSNDTLGGTHGPHHGPVCVTQVTEMGTVYSLQDLRDLTAIARSFGSTTHMDGARFANAIASLNCTPAEMSWKSGIDALTFGGTKNGLLGGEACVIFDPELAQEFSIRRKRGGHLLSKHRYLSAQMLAYLTDDLWLDLATQANAWAAQLATGIAENTAIEFVETPQANMIFARMPRGLHQRLLDAGATYYVTGGDPAQGDPDEMLVGRLVTNWATTAHDINQFLDIVNG